jgi:hypothetical protein
MITRAPTDARPVRTSRTTALPRLLTGLLLLGVAMTGAAVFAPELARRAGGLDHPDYLSIASIGVAMIALSSLFLTYAARVLGLGVAWLGLALLSNAMILVGKFVLAPQAFYRTTFVAGDPFLNVQSPAFLPILAAGVCIVQAGALALLYAWARGRASRALGVERSVSRRPGRVGALLTSGIALGAVALAAVFLYSGPSLIGYAMIVAATTGAAAAVAVLLATGAGGGALHVAASRTISVRDTAIVTSVFWLALSMLLVYQVVWVVFMAVLVGMWPLKVVAPSGK